MVECKKGQYGALYMIVQNSGEGINNNDDKSGKTNR